MLRIARGLVILGLGAGAFSACSIINKPDDPVQPGAGGAGGSGVATASASAASGGAGPSCSDGKKDGDETDVDCGGSCPKCADGKACLMAADCASGTCTKGVCADCMDGKKDGDETDVDCGGSCPKCAAGKACLMATDCASGTCTKGSCSSCMDGIKDGDETDVDCGGSCPPCGPGKGCAMQSDCAAGTCQNGKCQIELTFTTCGQTGATGPSQAQCDMAYPMGNGLNGAVQVMAGYQLWQVPADGSYQIEVWGAQGGKHQFGPGGPGAHLRGDFMLKKGQSLKILVGQKGQDDTNYQTGGGGGTFVALSDNTALIVAGGGGGAGNCGGGFNPMQQAGKAATGNGMGGASVNDGNYCGCGGSGSGGGGFNGDGGGNGGKSFIDGGAGCTSQRPGQCIPVGFGGFGGGGNGGNGGGGGGGYQGGDAGGPMSAAGQGGLSFNKGANPFGEDGVQMGDGMVVVRSL